MNDVQCYELFGGIAHKNHAFSFSSSMSAAAQALTSLIHDCIEQSSSATLSEVADMCSCKSSANEWCMIERESKMADKGLIYMVKSIA